MLLSVIIPVYNCENYLRNCLDSVLNQSSINYEIILINDGSTDRSLDICQDYASKYKNIIVESVENGGPSKARNIGLKISRGEYIQFLDSDDELCHSCFATMYQLMKNNNYPDVGIYQANILDGDRMNIGQEMISNFGYHNITDLLYKMESKEKPCILHYIWNKWYKSEIIHKYKVLFDEDIKLGEDFIFNCNYFKNANNAYLCDENLYNYFKRNMISLTSKFNIDELSRRRKMFSNFVDLYKSKKLYEKFENKMKCMESNICLISMSSISYESCKLSIEEKIKFLSEFMESEYFDILRTGFDEKCITGKQRIYGFLLLKKKYLLYICILKLEKIKYIKRR